MARYIRNETARSIAQLFTDAGGPIARFAANGEILPTLNGALKVTRSHLNRFVGTRLDCVGDRNKLDSLIRYVEHHTERGPVENWPAYQV